MIRRLYTYSPVKTEDLEFEYGYWLGQGYQPRMGKQGIVVYETRPQDETHTTIKEWVVELKADIKELMHDRTEDFYTHMTATNEGRDAMMREVERIEWLKDSMEAIGRLPKRATG